MIQVFINFLIFTSIRKLCEKKITGYRSKHFCHTITVFLTEAWRAGGTLETLSVNKRTLCLFLDYFSPKCILVRSHFDFIGKQFNVDIWKCLNHRPRWKSHIVSHIFCKPQTELRTGTSAQCQKLCTTPMHPDHLATLVVLPSYSYLINTHLTAKTTLSDGMVSFHVF